MTLNYLYLLAKDFDNFEEFEAYLKEWVTDGKHGEKKCNLIMTINALTDTEVYCMWVTSNLPKPKDKE